MTVIHAEDRFRPEVPAKVLEFIQNMGWDPVIELRRSGKKPLSECGPRGAFIADVIVAAIASIDAASFMTGLFWNDRSDTEGAIYYDDRAASSQGIQPAPGDAVEFAVGDAWVTIELWPSRSAA